jgi:hypothetical protein
VGGLGGDGLAKVRLTDLAAAIGLAAVPLTAALAGARGPLTLAVNLGPNDGAYVEGFLPLYEINPADQVATRWSTAVASVRMPVAIEGGPAQLSYRFARVLPETAVVETSLGDRMVDRFTCRGGAVETRRVRLAALDRVPAIVRFRVDSHDRRNLGLKMDWVRVDLASGAKAVLQGAARWRAVIVTLLVYVLLRWAGFAVGSGLLLTLPLAAGLAAWARLDPLAVAHVTAKVVLPAIVLGVIAVVAVRRQPAGRYAVAAFIAGYVLKAAAVFHPATFYPDVMNHRRYVLAMAESQGSLVERGVAAQVQVKTAYPRMVAGRPYAFPYSPLFFVPFLALAPHAEWIEDAMRHVALAAAAAEVLVVFWIAATVYGPPAGAIAALFSAVLPPLTSRLLLAMWPTLAGHLLDVLAFAAALRWAVAPDSLGRLLALGGASLAAFLTYIASLFNLTGFLVFLAGLERRRALRLLVVVTVAGTITVLLLYWSFTVTFFREILPALLSGRPEAAAARTGTTAGAAGGVLAELRRIPLFFGYGFPLLAIAGLALARREDPAHWHVLAAYGLSGLLLMLLRGLGGGLFKDLKEVEFLAPWIAVTAAGAIAALWCPERRKRLGAVLVCTGLTAFGLAEHRRLVSSAVSPVTSLEEPAPPEPAFREIW